MAGALWDEVRRAWGRRVGTARVHRMDIAHLRPQTAVRRSPVLDTPHIHSGPQEAAWPITASVRLLDAPSASPGGSSSNLAISTALAGGNATVSVHVESVRAALPDSACRVKTGPLRAWEQPVVRSAPLALAGQSAARRALLVTMPPLRALTHVRIGRASVKNGLSMLARVPLTRRRSAAPAGCAPAEAFRAERACLAQAANVPENAITLIGVYPHVPLSRARQLSVSDGGATLRLWLAPGKPPRAAPRLVTVIVGRHTLTGKALQAIFLPPRPEQTP